MGKVKRELFEPTQDVFEWREVNKDMSLVEEIEYLEFQIASNKNDLRKKVRQYNKLVNNTQDVKSML